MELNNDMKTNKFIIDGAPNEWLFLAEELMYSANLLWENVDQSLRVEIGISDINSKSLKNLSPKNKAGISRSYFLLVGFAIENLLKGLIIFDDPSTITDGILKKVKSHKLLSLITNIPYVQFTNDEKSIIKNIEDAIPYWGRYPIPLEPNNITPDIGVTPKIRTLIKSMYERLAMQLYKKLKTGWDSGTGVKCQETFIARFEDL